VIVSALRSLATYVGVSLYVLLAAPLGMFLAAVLGWIDLLYVLGHWGVRLGLWLCGIKIVVAGAENLPRGRAVVFCSNHQSNVDPPVLYRALHPRLHILYKHEIDQIPLLARAFRMAGFIPIDRRNKESALRSIEAGARSLAAGNSFLIFPEGTRSKTNDLLPFKTGGFVMALKAGAPVVPVAIQGSRDAMRRGSWLIQPITIRIRIGDPVETKDFAQGERGALIDTVRQRIQGMIALGSATGRA
jgi:1-acyl-sn-glycerol-3-phosphate acyltransferase